MFRKIQYRLLTSYLIVFASILGLFAIAVRIVFVHSIKQQLTDNLVALGQGAVSSAEFNHDRLEVGADFATKDLVARNQALQWFDAQGRLIAQQGKAISTLPFSSRQKIQLQTSQPRIQVITLPIVASNDRRLLGYVSASQSLEEFDENVRKLDFGLETSIMLALILSGIGGLWLTRQAMTPIEESFQRLQQFTADAAHELRSPLMAIKSNASVALRYPDQMRSSDAEKFAAIASATTQLTQLAEDLLLLTRSEQAVKHSRSVNLSMLLDDLVNLYQSQAQTQQINLRSEIAPSLIVLGDDVQLTRLFTNLIVNALHYTLANGTVIVSAARSKQTVVATVQDTGIGIAPEHLERVFDRFWRADQSRTYSSGGSGLGLAIAQSIAQSHNGSIRVTSEIGIGSCFTVRLPIANIGFPK